jgi:tetratricopeptide (TPR) repeat protein
MRNHWIYQAEKAKGSYFLTVGKFDLAESSFKKAYLSTEKILNDSDYGNVDTTRRAFSKETVLTNKADVLNLLARTLRNQGKLIEAEHRDRESLRTVLTISGRNNFRVVTILNSISLDLSEQGRGHEANVLAEYALKVVQESGLSRTSPKNLDIVNDYDASLVNV